MATEEQRRRRKEAAELADKIRIKAPSGFDSTRPIRESRDARFGPKRKKGDEPS